MAASGMGIVVRKDWGWTLMRRRPGDKDSMPIAEYLFIKDSGIPSFKTDTLYPFKRGDGKIYDGISLKSGTVVKLFDYQIGSKYMSFRGSRESFLENLVETTLPFRLLDFRQKPDPKRGGGSGLWESILGHSMEWNTYF